MKASEVIDILEQYESSEDMVIANPYPGFTARTGGRPDNYLHVIVTKHRGQLGAKGSSTIVARETTDAILITSNNS
jgi:hypothetical protein